MRVNCYRDPLAFAGGIRKKPIMSDYSITKGVWTQERERERERERFEAVFVSIQTVVTLLLLSLGDQGLFLRLMRVLPRLRYGVLGRTNTHLACLYT